MGCGCGCSGDCGKGMGKVIPFPGPYRAGLSAICTTPMCSAGADAVHQMDAVYQALPSTLQNSFQSAHDAIMTSFNSHWIFFDEFIPFNPVCCTIADLGNQADQLRCNMQVANDQKCESGLSPSPTDITNLIIPVGLLVAGVYVLSETGILKSLGFRR